MRETSSAFDRLAVRNLIKTIATETLPLQPSQGVFDLSISFTLSGV